MPLSSDDIAKVASATVNKPIAGRCIGGQRCGPGGHLGHRRPEGISAPSAPERRTVDQLASSAVLADATAERSATNPTARFAS